jgi:hypothetical protein
MLKKRSRQLSLVLAVGALLAAVLTWLLSPSQPALRLDGLIWMGHEQPFQMLRFFESDGKTWVEIKTCGSSQEREIALTQEEILFSHYDAAQHYRFPGRAELVRLGRYETVEWLLIETAGPIVPGLYHKVEFVDITCSDAPHR